MQISLGVIYMPSLIYCRAGSIGRALRSTQLETRFG